MQTAQLRSIHEKLLVIISALETADLLDVALVSNTGDV